MFFFLLIVDVYKKNVLSVLNSGKFSVLKNEPPKKLVLVTPGLYNISYYIGMTL